MITSYAETTTADYELGSSPQPSSSTSSTILSQEPWNKVQPSYAAKRKKMQAERMRQLKELEEQVTETANWNQRRKELVTTSSRRTLTTDDSSTIYPTAYPSNSSSSSSHSPIVRSRQTSTNSTTSKIDLGDATLEDLEGLIAASAKRLASYRLRNQKLVNSPDTLTQKKSDDMERWKEYLESNPSTSLNRLSNTKHYNADPLANDNNSFVTAVTSISPISSSSSTTTPSGEKSPSASYLRLRNMFEQKDTDPSSSRKSAFSLADLANPPPAHTRSKKKDDLSSTITTTRSTLSSASPKIESPRFSASTTPRSVHLRKATRRVVSPSASSSSLAESTLPQKTESTTRLRKLNTLASLQQRQRQQHSTNKEQETEDDQHKSVDDYMNSIKKTSSTTSSIHRHRLEKSIEEEQPVEITKRKVKLSITTSNASTTTTSRKLKETPTAITATTATKGPVIMRRKRGKVKSPCL
jgi:hypothetical protein